MVYLHPSVSVLQLDVDLAESEEDELFLLGALGDLGPGQGGLLLALPRFGRCLGAGETCLDGSVPLKKSRCPVALLLELVEKV
jgi:hypothetical protein